MTEAILGWGTLFQTEWPTGNWTTLAEVTSLGLPSISRDSIDASHENGPDEWRENLPSLKSAGEMKIEFNFVPGGDDFSFLKSELDDKVIRQRRVVFPNGSTLGFSAFLTGLDAEAPVDSQIKATATFQLSGQIALE